MGTTQFFIIANFEYDTLRCVTRVRIDLTTPEFKTHLSRPSIFDNNSDSDGHDYLCLKLTEFMPELRVDLFYVRKALTGNDDGKFLLYCAQ